jgi:hypothetical protein
MGVKLGLAMLRETQRLGVYDNRALKKVLGLQWKEI